MALDSQEKRMAASGVMRPWMRGKFPIATPDEEWRISSGLGYGGNALTPGTGGLISIAGEGGLAGPGGIAGPSGGIAG